MKSSHLFGLVLLAAMNVSADNGLHIKDVTNVFEKRFNENIYQVASGIHFIKRLDDFADSPSSNERDLLTMAYGCLVQTFNSKTDVAFVLRESQKSVGQFNGLSSQLKANYEDMVLEYVTDQRRNIANNANRAYVNGSVIRPKLCPIIPDEVLSSNDYIERLRGVDSNSNHLRDEVEFKIKEDFKQHPLLLVPVMNMARAYQNLLLTDYRNPAEISEAARLVQHATTCLIDSERAEFKFALANFKGTYKNRPVRNMQGYLEYLRELVFDNVERKRYAELIEFGLSSGVFRLPDAQSCAYYLSNLKSYQF